MALTLATASLPALQRTLSMLLNLLDKAEAHARARGFEPEAFLALRLAPDMLPFGRQIQIACDMAKGCAARLAGREVPKWADDESTLEQYRARIRRTLDFVADVDAAALDGADAREIVLPMRSGEMRMTGEAYLRDFVLPNLYFHASMVYALLRGAGVELGKKDFLG